MAEQGTLATVAPLAPEASASGDRAGTLALSLLLLLALLLRLVPAILYPGVDHPDEIFQSLEQAHRLVFGTGAVPWEYELGARSWLLPGSLAGLMWLASRFGEAPEIYLGFIHGVLAAFAATSVACAFFWGRRAYGLWGGVIASLLPALWPDAIYFAGRTLGECVAAPVLVIALCLLDTNCVTAIPLTPALSRTREGEGLRAATLRIFAAGLLFGVTLVLRLQLAPAILIAFLWTAIATPRRLAALAAGLGGALILAGALDIVTWGAPLQSLWLNFSYNIFWGVGSSFGAEPWYFYGVVFFQHDPVAASLVLICAALAARQFPLPAGAAAAIIAAHMLVPHKEERFLYPALLLLLILAGLGMARLVHALAAKRWFTEPAAALLLLAFIGARAFALAETPAYRELWQRGHDTAEATLFVSRLPELCGLAAYDTYTGYAYLHRDVPLAWPPDAASLSRVLPGVNTVIYWRNEGPIAGYAERQCFGRICVAVRPGVCAAMPASEMPHPAALDLLIANTRALAK
jgi:GPI mannosyltransferase 3